MIKRCNIQKNIFNCIKDIGLDIIFSEDNLILTFSI